MRPIERIDNFLDKVNFSKVINEIWKLNLSGEHIDMIELEKEYLRKKWKENQDWRFSQLLVNVGLIPNVPGFWYYTEEYDLLEKLGYQPRETRYWGTNFTPEMKRLNKTEYKLIKDLDTEHIQAIIDGQWVGEKNPYYTLLTEELKLRKNE